MINKIFKSFKELEKLAQTITKSGLKFCFLLCIISLVFLLTYDFFVLPLLFSIGILLLKLSFIFGVEFIICAFVTDKIKKQLI